MSDESSQSQTPPSRIRRSSFAGQTFADLFGNGRPSMSRGTSENKNNSPPTQQMPGPISQAAAQAQQRRLSLTTLGLSGSPTNTSAFNSVRNRGDSIGSANSGSIEESAIAEDDATARDSNLSSSPGSSTPFHRRTSFGARALRDIRTGSFNGQAGGNGVPGSPGQNGSSEGFNWSDNLRTRAERTSISGQGALGGGLPATNHSRSKSVATMDPPPVAPPKPKERPRPDHFQERILKGDFYMD